MADLSLSRLSWRVQLGVFVALSLGAGGAFHRFIEAPTHDRIAERRRELATIRARIDKQLLIARDLSVFRTEVAELRARLNGLRSMLPVETDGTDLLRSVHSLAGQANLRIRGFRPQAMKSGELHAEWPVGLELEGTYHNVGAFLDNIGKFPRILTIDGLTIRGKALPQPNTTVDVACTARTFVLLDKTIPPPTPGTLALSLPIVESEPVRPTLPNYAYQHDGRRDPFISLVSRTTSGSAAPIRPRPLGLSGVLIEEVVVQGIVQSRTGWMAIVRLPNGRTHWLRPGDRVMDGSLDSISQEALVFIQTANGQPFGQKPREVRKYLRGRTQ